MRLVFSGLAAAAWLISSPALAQETPKSLLPDVFGAPPAQPAAEPAPAPATGEEAAPAADGASPVPPPSDLPPALPASAAPDPFATAPDRVRNIDVAGPLPSRLGGYGANAFAGSNGAFLTALLNQTRAPFAARWVHIVARRALLSRVPTPAGVRPADWIAARARLLVAMGEADGAKLLVDDVPIDRYTVALYGVASDAHLAAADVPALCPLAATGRSIAKTPFWDLAVAVCAGIEGDDITSATYFDRVRASNKVASIDVVLSERVTSVASGEGRAANVEWQDNDQLTPLRFGFASAAGVAIPDALTAALPSRIAGWIMRAPNVSEATRGRAAPIAAAAGIVSARELAALAAIDTATDGGTPDGLAEQLRVAFAGRSSRERIDAMQAVWAAASSRSMRYGRYVQTAEAAARIPPSSTYAADCDELVKSMLSAGLVRPALAWWPVLKTADERARMAVWPLLAIADPGNRIAATPEQAQRWYSAIRSEDRSAKRKAALFAAVMRGLGKGNAASWNGFARSHDVEPVDNSYTRALAAAAKARRKGEVALLGAVGMQSAWAGVAPGLLEAILRAYRRVGLNAEARMLGVEALTRN
jgi:hypothetical protein